MTVMFSPFSLLFEGRIEPNKTEKEARQFIRTHGGQIRRLTRDYYEASWRSTCQGADYVAPGQSEPNEKVQTRLGAALTDYLNNKDAFVLARRLMGKKSRIANPGTRKQLETLFHWFKTADQSEKLIALQKKLDAQTNFLEGRFNTYVATVAGQAISDLDLRSRLEQTTDPQEAKILWRARWGHGLHPVGKSTLAKELVKLVKLRNQVARMTEKSRGKHYDNYFSMSLHQNGIDEKKLLRLMTQIELATREPYQRLQRALDQVAQGRFGLPADQVQGPWLGSGNAKRLMTFDMQPYLKGKNPLALLEQTARLMGDSVQAIFDRSVYEKNGQMRSALYFDPAQDAGKSQHWFSFGVSPPDDVRTFASMDPAHDQMVDYAVETLLHETTGHGLDSRYLSPRLPYLMRNHHAITTESHAMLMEDIVQEPAWWESVVKLPSAKAQAVAAQAQAYTKLQKLRGLRWMVSLIQFERELYRNPGQNLTRLWWQLQKQYLGEEPGDQAKLPVYAGIPHFFSHPVYYQNYFLADLARSQKLETIQTRYGSLLTPEAGDYLKTYRKVGQRYDWDDLVERMTGEPLGVKAIQRELSGLTLPDAPAS